MSGETFRCLGRQYRLKVERTDDGNARVRVIDGRLVVPVPAKGDNAANARARLVTWYRRDALRRLGRQVVW